LLASVAKFLHVPVQNVVPAGQGALQVVAFMQPVGGQGVVAGDEHAPLEHVSWPLKLPPEQLGPEPHKMAGVAG
jgi:hypothetical protein